MSTYKQWDLEAIAIQEEIRGMTRKKKPEERVHPLDTFIKVHKLTMKCTKVPSNPYVPAESRDAIPHFWCVIKKNVDGHPKQVSTLYSAALPEGEEPKLRDVLDLVKADAAPLYRDSQYNRDRRRWIEDCYGDESDDTALALRSWRAARRLLVYLNTMFGGDAVRTLMRMEGI